MVSDPIAGLHRGPPTTFARNYRRTVERPTKQALRLWRTPEAAPEQRYRDFLEYQQGRRDGRLGNPRARLSPAYVLGFELGRLTRGSGRTDSADAFRDGIMEDKSCRR